MSTRFSLVDYEVTDDDHLRLSVEAVHAVGEAAQVLAAIYTAAGADQGRTTFASYAKLAAVACCSLRTVKRVVADDGPLVEHGYLERHGRQPLHPKTRKKRRTVSLTLTRKAVRAFDRFYKLPRVLVHLAQDHGHPLNWSERLLLAFFVSRHTLVEQIELQQLGSAETRHCHSLAELVKATGLTMKSVISGRRGLERRRMIVVGENFDGAKFEASEITLNGEAAIAADRFPMPAVDVLQGAAGPPKRTWQASVKAREKTRPENVALVALESCHQGTGDVAPVPLEMWPGGTGDVALGVLELGHSLLTSPINESSETNPPNESPLLIPGTNQHQQAGADPGSKCGRGKADQDKGKHTAEQDERQRRLASRDVKLIRYATTDQGKAYVEALNARDFDTAESILDAIETTVTARATA